MVDGKVWVASKKYINTVGGRGTYAHKHKDFIEIQLDLRSVTGDSEIFIQLYKDNVEINKVYDIPGDYYYSNSGTSYSSMDNDFFTKQPNYTGKIKFTRIDIPRNIVSGTFEFDVVDEEVSKKNKKATSFNRLLF